MRFAYCYNLVNVVSFSHRCTKGGGGGMKQYPPPRQIFEKLVNKNAIKPKIGGPPW
jgi:hypothetical protein